jgi:hypothetical protein
LGLKKVFLYLQPALENFSSLNVFTGFGFWVLGKNFFKTLEEKFG